jgi:hypothetical protein
MADKPFTLELTDTSLRTKGQVQPLGCVDLETPRGVVHFHDAPGLLTTCIEREGQPSTVGSWLYDPPDQPSTFVHGYVTQLEPDNAREVAASLLRMADRADGGKRAS